MESVIRNLKHSDFPALVELARPCLDAEVLPFDAKRAMEAFRRLCTDRKCFAAGQFEDEKLTGAIGMASGKNAYAPKYHASLVFWLGPIRLFDLGIDWFRTRPANACFMVAFDRPIRPGVDRLLQRRGFERRGDMRVLWS